MSAAQVLAELDPEADAQLGLPDMLGQYHSIYPLEDVAQVSNLLKIQVTTTRPEPWYIVLTHVPSLTHQPSFSGDCILLSPSECKHRQPEADPST